MSSFDDRILGITGWMDETDMRWLHYFAGLVPKDGLIVEIGSWMGRSSIAIYTGASGNKKVVSIDTWKGSPSDIEHKIAGRVDIFQKYLDNCNLFNINPQPYSSDSANGVYYINGDSVNSACLFDDNSIDWVFIDGDHEKCGADIDAFIPKIKTNGIISGHDYFCFYNTVQKEIHKRFYIHAIKSNIWLKFMEGDNPPDWYV